MERVTFPSHGETLVGHLYPPTPSEASEPHPTVVLLGPETFVKEQAPSAYARRLAREGVAALAFDPRYWGESTGEPERWENPDHKVEDVFAAVDYLTERADIGAVGGFALCHGCAEMVRAAADDDRIGATVCVAGHYRDEESDADWLGPAALDARRERGEAAVQRFEETGRVDYVPAAHPDRGDVGMPGHHVWEWYRTWAAREWDNRYAVLSDADVLDYESLSAARRLRSPMLMVHSDRCALPSAARRHFAAVPAREKQLVWDGDTPHFAYYDEPAVVRRTARLAASWYGRHLAT